MYKLLIVEDEPLIRSGLVAKIKALDLPISEYFEAEDADHAVALFSKALPDILITDIRMKNRDGLSLIGELKQLKPNLQCIIVSGYPEFEYAKKAIELGVLGYVLKPVGLAALNEQLTSAISNITRATNKENELSELETQLNSLNFISELNYIIHLTGEADAGSGKNLTKFFPESGNYILAALSIDRCSFANSIFTLQDIEIIIYSIKNIARDIVFVGTKVVFNNIVHNNQQLILFVLDANENGNKSVLQYCTTLVEMIEQVLQLTVSFGISDTSEHVSQSIYRQTQRRLKGRQLGNLSSAFLTANPPPFVKTKMIEHELVQLSNCIKNYDISRLNTSLSKLIVQGESIDYYGNILGEIAQVLRESTFDTETLQSAIGMMSNPNMQIGWLFEASGDIREFLNATITGLFPTNSNEHVKSSYKIALAVKYICKNYKTPITVNYLAELYDMNANYFSSLFKKEVGQTIVNYLTEVRLENAKNLLKTTDLSNNEIAETVGYENVQYFYKVFKKATGITPTAFRSE